MKEIYLVVEQMCGNAEQTRHALYFETLRDAMEYSESFFRLETQKGCHFEDEVVYSQYGATERHLKVIPYVRDYTTYQANWYPCRIESHTMQTNKQR